MIFWGMALFASWRNSLDTKVFVWMCILEHICFYVLWCKKHKLRKKIPVQLRSEVWKKQFQKQFSALCPCCQQSEIDIFNFEVGHKVAVAKKGSNQLSNLIPICRSCNASMGTMDFDAYCHVLNQVKK